MSSRRKSARLSTAALAKEETPKLKEYPPILQNTSKKRKTISKDTAESLPNSEDAGPSTPKRKRAVKVPVTPAAIGLMSSPHKGKAQPPALTRLAVPNGTNATLVTPETHRTIANKPIDEISPSKKPNITTTSENVLEEALAHLVKVEPKLKLIIEKFPCPVFSPEGLAEEIDPFNSLVSGIISQQVSGAAAKSIKAKFVALFNPDNPSPDTHTFPTPSQVTSLPLETLRTAGLSQRKAEYISGLALKFTSGDLTTQFLFSATYEEVFEELIKVRGLGKWSVEMFACFGLKRLDVFSTGDLGVQRGLAVLDGRDVKRLKSGGKGKWKYMSEKDMEAMAERFRPYRSVLMWYTWRVEEGVDVSSFDQ